LYITDKKTEVKMITEELKKETLQLKPLDKVRLLEILIKSLDEINPEIEKVWVEESEKRYANYKSGKLDSVSFDAVKKSIVR
jgi:hypothetical protein